MGIDVDGFTIEPEREEDGTLVACVAVPGGYVACGGRDEAELRQDFLEGLRVQREAIGPQFPTDPRRG